MSKNDMKKLGIQSPNEADAVMMSLYQPAAVHAAADINFTNWN
jgi:hypothetical protein